jgi:histidinol-phosphate aminotransferase
MQGEFQIENLIRENIRRLVPYSSARDEFSGTASVFMDANENPFNPPLNRYPDPRQAKLKERLAAIKGQKTASLFLGNGSDEGIDLLFRIFCEPGRDNVITVDPTYGMYAVCAAVNDIERRSVMLREDFSLDPGAVMQRVDRSTKLIFLCSPNNPTSNSLDRKAMVDLIDRAPCMVVVDEAYADFSRQPGLLPLVPEKANLVVLQTLSKAWGLAGIRLGMVFAHPLLTGFLTSVKYPYNINTLTIREAMTCIGKDDERRSWVARILTERERLSDALRKLNFVEKVYPSDANFLLVKMTGHRKVYDHLMERGIIVRDRSSAPQCERCLRITVGTEQENQLLVAALQEYKP